LIVQFKIGLQAFAWISARSGKLDASGRGVLFVVLFIPIPGAM
jgi:hypothetical protein